VHVGELTAMPVLCEVADEPSHLGPGGGLPSPGVEGDQVPLAQVEGVVPLGAMGSPAEVPEEATAVLPSAILMVADDRMRLAQEPPPRRVVVVDVLGVLAVGILGVAEREDRVRIDIGDQVGRRTILPLRAWRRWAAARDVPGGHDNAASGACASCIGCPRCGRQQHQKCEGGDEEGSVFHHGGMPNLARSQSRKQPRYLRASRSGYPPHAVRGDTLGLRELNRATLARQMLLRRETRSALDAVEHLVGMQAQVPMNPYLGLWSRLERFRPEELAELLADRRVVRTVVMRATIHLVTADDCLILRPLMQPVLDAEISRHQEYGPLLRGIDIRPVLRFARELFAQGPMTGPQLRAALDERFPEQNAAALAYACRNYLALVQVPPRGVWGRTAQVTTTTAESWLGRSLATEPSIDDVVVRYLAAFGPASVADVAAWSRLTGMREVLDRVRPRLRTFRGPVGKELYDLPDAPRPDADTPAPPRFLPEYDNLLLSHADRRRFITDEHRVPPPPGLPVHGSVLSNGSARGTWRVDRTDGASTLVIHHAGPLAKRATAALAAEGRRLVRFLHPSTELRDVRFVAMP
jgi:Winged helix DNA-binding domain